MIRVILPYHLCRLSNVDRETQLDLKGPVTIAAVLDALEARYPMLKGTIRDQTSKERRPFIRFFVVGEDWSLDGQDVLLPELILRGEEPFRIVGAMAGG